MRSLSLCFAAALTAGACATAVEGIGPQQTSTDSAGRLVDVRLTYFRPFLFDSEAARPQGFAVIANYLSSDVTTEYQGNWNDENQTLTATIRLPVGSENLVYVVDEAVPPFTPTRIEAARQGRLSQVECTPAVTTVQVCYGLTITTAR